MMDGPLSETLSRVRRIGRDLLPGHPLFSNAEAQPATPTEAAFDAGPVFDVTFSDEEELPPRVDFEPFADEEPTEVPTPVAPDVENIDDDLDDFMKSAFDASHSEPRDAEGAHEGFDLTLDLEDPAQDGESSFTVDEPEEKETDPVSTDIDNEFDVLLDELLQEDAESATPHEEGLSLEPQGAVPAEDMPDDNLLNDLLDLTKDDPEGGSTKTDSYSDGARATDEESEAAPTSESEVDAGNTIFKMPGKLSEFPTREDK